MPPFHISIVNCRSDLGKHLREGAVDPEDRLCYACNHELPLSYISLIDIYLKSCTVHEPAGNSIRLPTPQSPLVQDFISQNAPSLSTVLSTTHLKDSLTVGIDKCDRKGEIVSIPSHVQCSFTTEQDSSTNTNLIDVPFSIRYLTFHDRPTDNHKYIKVTIDHHGFSESGYVRIKPTATDFYSFGVFDLSSINFGTVLPNENKIPVNKYDRYCISKALGTTITFDSLAISPIRACPLNPSKYQYVVIKYGVFPDLPSAPGKCGLVLDLMSNFPSYPLRVFTSRTGTLWRYLGDYLFNIYGELDPCTSWEILPEVEREHWIKFFISGNRKLKLSRLIEMGFTRRESLSCTPEVVRTAFVEGRLRLRLVLVKFVIYDQEFTERMDRFVVTLRDAT
ncbi:hypothetical protein NEOLI_000174 [Neolecta irregularis DAH-3]|uniref:DUF6697 domain-containing protein n=1 Tax=Neolecta irregularis (strain DAH-3) TaxID=1198029 RepID=A0A1U7LU07_NEOID|nr:hypothetical protein NEOLI_000174 [Neolecta irregularis DAH-3]|eukprot:OLL26001.1 hypothetical protein NEOLI_000174 [Neolecta irregularis DAH-3]